MADITMPQLGETVTEGTITRWFKQVGEQIAEDEVLFEVSTDKVDSEVPSPVSGYLVEIRAQEGDTVDVGAVLAVVGDAPADGGAAPAAAPAAEPAAAQPAPAPAAAAEEPAAPAPAPESAPEPTPQPAAQEPAPAPAAPAAEAAAPAPAPAAPPAEPAATQANGSSPGLLLSPVVRRLIEENGLDPARITGTGVGGRITRSDVLSAIDAGTAKSAPAAPGAPGPAPASGSAPAAAAPRPSARPAPRSGTGDTVEPLNNIRRRTGEHMVMSKSVSPHVLTAVDVDYEAIERVRKPAREQFKAEEGFSLTYLPFQARAVIDALREFPYLNATVGEGELVVHNYVNLAIAVDLNFTGLVAPVIRDADDMRLRAIARGINDVATRARSKQLMPDDISGGTFTLSNSGSFGSFMVAPIINQPQVAILSTDGVKRRPVVVTSEWGEESIAIHSVGMLTLSWDHRAFDGAYAAAFMQRVKEIMETRDWSVEL